VHNGQVRIGAGGAIVDLSDSDDEIEEVLLKCKGLLRAFNSRIADGSVETDRRQPTPAVSLLV
jgi:anthranilate/para-aminobenzoate synthase component I